MSAVAPSQLRRRLTIAAAAALAVLAVAPQGAAARGCANSTADPGEVSIAKLQRATLCILNRRRHRHGVGALRANARLTAASARHARDMARRNYFEHGDFVGRIRASGFLSGARSWMVGENIAWGTGRYARPAAIVRSWMNSPPHRHNILDSDPGEDRVAGLARAVGSPVVLAERPERRLAVLAQDALRLPVVDRAFGMGVGVFALTAPGEVDLDDVVGGAAQQLLPLGVVDHVVGRRRDVLQGADTGEVVVEGLQGLDVGHGRGTYL